MNEGNLVNKITRIAGVRSYQVSSFFILAASVVNGAVGLVFWSIAARLYPQEEIGVASGLISAMTLGFSFSKLGLDQSLLRFFSGYDRRRITTTTLVMTGLAATVTGVLLMLFYDVWLPESESATDVLGIVFVLSLVCISLAWIGGRALIAARKPRLYLAQVLVVNTKPLGLFVFFSLGAFGILLSYGLAYAAALLLSLVSLAKVIDGDAWKFDRDYLRKSFFFSFGTYLYGFLMLMPMQFIPLIILNLLGPTEAAIYYLPFVFVSALFVIPDAFGTSFVVESSYGQNHWVLMKQALANVFSLLGVAVLFFFFFGESILSIVGGGYGGGYPLLRIMSLSSLLVSICILYFAYLLVKMRIRLLVLLSGLVSTLQIGSCAILIGHLGVTGAGYSWLFSYGIVCLVILGLIARDRRTCMHNSRKFG